MGIVTKEVHTEFIRKARKHVRYRFTDHEGRQYLTSERRIPTSVLTTDHMDLVAFQFEEMLDKSESDLAVLRVEAGEDALQVATSFNHSTQKNIVKKLIRWAMKSENVFHLLSLKPLIIHLKDNFTNTQIANFLDITTDQLLNLNTRYNRLVTIESDLIASRAGEEF